MIDSNKYFGTSKEIKVFKKQLPQQIQRWRITEAGVHLEVAGNSIKQPRVYHSLEETVWRREESLGGCCGIQRPEGDWPTQDAEASVQTKKRLASSTMMAKHPNWRGTDESTHTSLGIDAMSIRLLILSPLRGVRTMVPLDTVFKSKLRGVRRILGSV